MAKVKIKIEVNPNADDEELGNIQNQVNNTPSLENVSNVSVKIRGDGIYEEIPSNSGGINGLSLGYDLVFDENGYLDNADLEGGVLESTENPVEFVWGVVPENGEYTVRLTFTDAQNLKDITIFGDSEVNQFPTRAIIDGYKEITNDDITWYINFGNESNTHTIEFTHWNKVNYNACLSKIGITLQYIEIDKTSGLKSVDSTSQSSTDTTGIFYGTVENRGSLEMLDKTGELVDMLKDGIIDNSNTKLEIVANNETIQTHISTDSTYNANSQVMSLDLGNRLSSLDILKYKGYDYPDHSERLSVLLFDVLSNLRYALFGKDKELTQEEFKEMLSGKYDKNQTLYDYLYSCKIEYPFITTNKTYREVIDEFCLIAQMQMFIDDDDCVKFVSARPRIFDKNFKAIHIPKKNMFTQLDYNVITKNKYDGVEISKTIVQDIVDYATILTRVDFTITDTSKLIVNKYIDSNYNSLGKETSLTYIEVDAQYYSGSIEFERNGNQNLEQILVVFDSILKDKSYTYSNNYTKKTQSVTAIGNPSNSSPSIMGIGVSVSNIVVDESSTEIEKDLTSTLNIDETINYNYNGVVSESILKDKNESRITNITESDSKFKIDFIVLCGKKVLKLEGGQTTSSETSDASNVSMNGIYEIYEPISGDLSLYGNKRLISFKQKQASTPNIESAKTKVALNSSVLLQEYPPMIKYIKNNILKDYMFGISNASVSVSCSDYYDSNNKKVIDWASGKIFRVGDIVYFDNDKYNDGSQRYWRVRGRTFRKTGVPMQDLQLEEIKQTKSLEDSSWDEINYVATLDASSEFSLGDTKKIHLNDGKIITATIIDFHKYEILNDKLDSISFAVFDLNESSPMGTFTNMATLWSNSIIRNEFLPNVYSRFPIILHNYIKPVTKFTLIGDGMGTDKYIEETQDILWLFAINEIYSPSELNEEGKTYAYFKILNIKDVIEKDKRYWFRTVTNANNINQNNYIEYTEIKLGVATIPSITYGEVNNSTYDYNIFFGFTIGT